MARFLANENAPREAVLAARGAGFDVAWMVELQPGASDEIVLSRAQRDDRVLITFDKDFGELIFRHDRAGSPGVILLRPRLRSPEIITAFIVTVLSQPIDWTGHFTVAREGSLRVIPLR
jgi:predicted nuclease of predicted toxin-antitoxin system